MSYLYGTATVVSTLNSESQPLSGTSRPVFISKCLGFFPPASPNLSFVANGEAILHQIDQNKCSQHSVALTLTRSGWAEEMFMLVAFLQKNTQTCSSFTLPPHLRFSPTKQPFPYQLKKYNATEVQNS